MERDKDAVLVAKLDQLVAEIDREPHTTKPEVGPPIKIHHPMSEGDFPDWMMMMYVLVGGLVLAGLTCYACTQLPIGG